MTKGDLMAVLPAIFIAASAVAVLMLTAFYRSHFLTVMLTTAGFVGSFILLFPSYGLAPRPAAPLLVMDGYSIFFMGLILVTGFIVGVLSYDYFEGRDGDPEEFYLLLLLATLGSMVLVSARHFVSFFLGLEVLSVSLYAMVAYVREADRSTEAGIKYLVLAGVASAFLLFGMALVYSGFGTMEFAQIAGKAATIRNDPVIFAGLALTVVGLGFKLGLVPFHMWTPDVYEGAPPPVAAFVATVSKGAVFALLLRYLGGAGLHVGSPLFVIFSMLSIASMFTGNLLALSQRNMKRILAYSSIAHLGYLLVAFLSGGDMALTAVSYYLVAYFITMLGAFGVITVVSGTETDKDLIDDYRGLAGERPWLAGIFTAMLFSLAGIPLTAGFIGKFYLVAAGVDSALWFLVIILAVNSAIAIFYYLRVVVVLFMPSEKERPLLPVSFAGGLMTFCLAAALFLFGVFPSVLVDLIREVTTSR